MILIIDDDPAIRSSLSFMLKRAGYETLTAEGPKEAMAVARTQLPRLVLMDMNYSLSTSGDEGITLLKQMKLFLPEVPIILMTAWGSIQLAVEGMQAGAFDFVTKPWNNAALMQRIQTALQLTEPSPAASSAPSAGGEANDGGDIDRAGIVGESAALREVLAVVKRVAHTGASVLITGESGTGKELIAEAIHRNSPRRRQPFVKVNLGGISQSLFESEMFGHKKGAFTDASADRVGRFEMADKGTIFLDEIGDLDLNCQVKLLRVLQEQTFEVLGDSRPRKVDIRVVSATNADLDACVANHTFRQDLLYRINLITIHLPALRERREDIPLLVNHFVGNLCAENRLSPVRVTAEAMDYLQSLPYPGNIRELKNLVERTLLVSGKPVLQADDFRRESRSEYAGDGMRTLEGMTLEKMERHVILQALKRRDNNLSQVAKELGISRAALYRRLEKLGIDIQG
jgi:two-component system NtrC family response regulator